MKKLFTALTIAAVLFLFGGFVEAAPFTQEQVDKLMNSVNQNPAASPDNKSLLMLTPAQFKTNFNTELRPVLNKAEYNNDEERALMENIFLIKDYQVFEAEGGLFFLNVFGNNTAVFGVTGNDNNRFKLLNCAYTKPENPGEEMVSSMVLMAFVTVVAPEENPQQVLKDLGAEESGTLTRGGVKFTAAKDGDLILLSAVKAAD